MPETEGAFHVASAANTDFTAGPEPGRAAPGGATGRPRKPRRKLSSKPEVRRVRADVWAHALRLAAGDPRRIEIIDAATVMIRKHAPARLQ